MDVSLNLNERLSQQLVLSPQMLQSIQVLALNIAELHELVAAEVERNPLLAFPSAWTPQVSGIGLLENLTRAEAPSLRDDLRFQLHVSSLPAADQVIGEYIIDCIDERGYLMESPADIASQFLADPAAVDRVLAAIRGFEPAGVGAADIRECLLLQLAVQPEPDACAIRIVQDFLEDVAHERIDLIARQTGFDEGRVRDAIRLIRSLRLYPGEGYGEAHSRWILPEVEVVVAAGQATVQLCNELPPLQIDDSLTGLAGDDEEAGRFIHDAMARATWLVHCLDQRRRTLLQVATAIIRQQAAHFLAGTPPVPLTLETIATELDLAISTVSRAISDRHYLFGRKVYPFRDLFPSRLRSGESDALIKAEIQRLIGAENRRSPLSDQTIADTLAARGMTVARRTVAKYRTELGIETASQRRA